MLLTRFAQQVTRGILLHEFTCRNGFVIIAGAPAVGKTLICRTVQHFHSSLSHVEMESYFLDSRKKRREMGLNGFDLETYNVNLMETHLLRYIGGNCFSLPQYDHGEGFLPQNIEISPSRSILFEGFAFFSLLPKYNDFCIAKYFIFPSRTDEWLSIHVQRDQRERSSVVCEDILWAEVHQKARSLAISSFLLQPGMQDTQFVSLDYGEDEFSNQYSFATEEQGKEFIHAMESL
jgi:uridine kinase